MKLPERFKLRYAEDPHPFHYYSVLLIALGIRLVVSLRQWGILHPDEIFQSLEIAHKIVFDSGFVPPEFENEEGLIPGYNAIRSYIFPLIFALFMWFGKLLGLDYFSFTLPTIKIFLALNSTLLLPVIYKLSYHLTNDKKSSLHAMVFTAFWFRIIEMTTRSLINTFFLPYLFYGILLVLRSLQSDSIRFKDVMIIGICLGLVTYVRIDLGMIVFLFFIFTFQYRHWRKYSIYTISAFCWWIIGALVDYYMYENVPFFVVPVKWIRFNIIENTSEMFGVSSVLYYVAHLMYADLLLIWMIPILTTWYNHRTNRKSSIFYIKDQQRREGFDLLFKIVTIVWIVYSYPVLEFQSFSLSPLQLPVYIRRTHKEIRFLIGGLILLTTLIGINFQEMIDLFVRLISRFPKLDHKLQSISLGREGNQRHTRRWAAVTCIGLLLLATNLAAIPYRAYDDNNENINLALMYVGQQEQVDDVLVMEVWYWTGQYTYSHLDSTVPIYWVYFQTPNEANISEEVIYEFIFLFRSHRYFIIDTTDYPPQDQIYLDLMSQNFIQINQFETVHVYYAQARNNL